MMGMGDSVGFNGISWDSMLIQWWFNGDLMGFRIYDVLPGLANIEKAIEHGTFMVDLPIHSMVMFQFVM